MFIAKWLTKKYKSVYNECNQRSLRFVGFVDGGSSVSLVHLHRIGSSRSKENHYLNMKMLLIRSGAFFIQELHMNELLEKFMDYREIVQYKFCYELSNGAKIKFKYKQTDFPHLIGLHKLIDIPIIRQFNDLSNKAVSAKYIISKIKKEEILTEATIKNSLYFQKIESRYQSLKTENLLSIAYTDAIIDFNPNLINSTLHAKYILFEEQGKGYNHLCLAEDDRSKPYAESFFYEETDLYLKNQIKARVKNVKIYDKYGNVYLEDNL